MTILDAAHEELNADDQPDEEWLRFDMPKLEDLRCKLQQTLRTIKLGHSDKFRLKIERLDKYMETRRQQGSKQWLSQVRVGAAGGWRMH